MGVTITCLHLSSSWWMLSIFIWFIVVCKHNLKYKSHHLVLHTTSVASLKICEWSAVITCSILLQYKSSFNCQHFPPQLKVFNMLQYLWWLNGCLLRLHPCQTQISPITIMIGDGSSWLLVCTVVLSILSLVYFPNQFAECTHTLKHIACFECRYAQKLKDVQFVFVI